MTALLIQTFIPLVLLILLGFGVGRWHRVDLKSVAVIAIYAITPVVAFGSAARLDFTFSLVLLPVCTFLLAAIIGLAAFWLGRCLKHDGTRYLLPVACGSGNTGYFGLPVAMALFGPDAAGLYFLANLGVVVFETSLGYYFIARGNLSPGAALKKVAQLPVLYALAAGLAFAAFHLALPEPVIKLWELSRGAYVVIGMMIAGIALSQAPKFSLNPRLLSLALLGKFALWPLAATLFAALDPGLFSAHIHDLIIVLSLTPIAANLPAYAAANDGPVAEAAMLVLISTALALLALPFVFPYFLQTV